MRGTPNRWDPWAYVREIHPDARVVMTRELPDRVLGGVDHKRRIIWLALGLSDAQARSVLAYELAELQQGPIPADPCTAAAHRRAAEDWAALMLIDVDDLLMAIGCSEGLSEMAAMLGVDTPTVRARFRGLSNSEQDAVFLAHRGKRLTA